MKKILNTIKATCAFWLVLLFVSCQENFNDRYLIAENSIEFDDAVIKAVEVGKDYAVVARTLSQTSTAVTFQVNLIGQQPAEDQNIQVRVVQGETTAVEGRDFALNNTVTIAKGSSKATVTVNSATSGVGNTLLVLELVGNDRIKVSKNYSKIGLKCVYP